MNPLCEKRSEKVAGYSRYASYSLVYHRVYLFILITTIATIIGAMTAGSSDFLRLSGSPVMSSIDQNVINEVTNNNSSSILVEGRGKGVF